MSPLCSTVIAWMTPSASIAIRTLPCSLRECGADSRFSRRSSIHFTGAPRSRDASTTEHSSRNTNIFWPNPPPTSRAVTVTWPSDTPRYRAKKLRVSCTDCVAHTMSISSRPGVHEAMIPRVSIGTLM